jgi:hypothetical protein
MGRRPEAALQKNWSFCIPSERNMAPTATRTSRTEAGVFVDIRLSNMDHLGWFMFPSFLFQQQLRRKAPGPDQLRPCVYYDIQCRKPIYVAFPWMSSLSNQPREPGNPAKTLDL